MRVRDGKKGDKCLCPDKCITSASDPPAVSVCGSDGRDYVSQCELLREACLSNRTIKSRFSGHCDPCDHTDCPPHESCQLDESRNPQCRCLAACEPVFRPVCASNGKTYMNDCVLRDEACKSNKSLRLLYNGRCGSGRSPNPCESLSCHLYQECEIDRYGIATCICPDACPVILKPVCGSDGVTYDSECDLKQKSCLKNALVTVRFWGTCDQSELCVKAGCTNKAVCHIGASTRRASCECPSCSDEFQPVCASNFMTFQNECHLKRHACEHNQSISVIASQPCDGCENEHCEFYGLCQSHGLSAASCVCPDNCPRNQTPVCGSDGATYDSECELKRFSCLQKIHVTTSSLGPCDVCDNVHCKYGARCEKGRCVCPTQCPASIERVCASDGKTYINECELRSEACRTRRNLRILYTGLCGSGRGPNPCESLNCHPYQDCEIDRSGIAACVCPDACPAVLKPVCGSDGLTYNSECDLRQKACLKNSLITVKFGGGCDHSESCRKAGCVNGAVCHIEASGQAACLCPSCTEEYKPVCGSNSLTFQNECHLRKYACERNQSLSMISTRACRGCEDKHCEWHALCQSRDPDPATCICPDVCARNQTPVCGSDGITYESECEMKRYSCNEKLEVSASSRGPCDVCLNVHCKYGARCEQGRCLCPIDCPESIEPVCSSDGKTYVNECVLRAEACKSQKSLRIMYNGLCGTGAATNPCERLSCHPYQECEIDRYGIAACVGGLVAGGYIDTCDHNTCRYGGVCDYDSNGIPTCVCSFNCPPSDPDHESVCGSDGRLYENECKLQEESCRRQQDIKPQSSRSCEETTGKPCDGGPPAIDPLTGKEISCSDGTAGCPSGNYCHRTVHFAKCCKQLLPQDACDDTTHGCCPDGRTAAQGPGNAGCPSVCKCNRMGSYSQTCDPVTKQCHCKPGVGGLQCDRCEAGYWGLHKISEGNRGCIPCSCNTSGSIRDDCEQMTGRCVCKPGLQGIKCNVCPDGTVLQPDGCIDVSLTRVSVRSCSDIKCKFMAVCKDQVGKGSQCICDIECGNASAAVCGSDGNSYPSECLMNQQSCRLQKKIFKTRDDSCRPGSASTPSGSVGQIESSAGVTIGPVRRSTIYKSSSPFLNGNENFASPVEKSTRELYWISVSKQMSTRPTDATATPPEAQKAIKIPSFSGDSLIEMQRLQAYTRLTIELEFTSFSENAILLYNGQTGSGEGDFVSLSLKQGYVEFRFNLGSGAEILRSPQKILLGREIRIVAKRYLRDGTLTVEGQEDVAGKSPGDLKSLDLAESLFIGHVAVPHPKILENIGVKQGFIGCLHRIRVGAREMDLSIPGSRDVIKSFELTDCSENPCSGNPCKNDANCFPDRSDAESFSCYCEQGFTGKRCEIKITTCGSDNPCVRGSTCTKLPDASSFSCLCPPGRSGTLCSDLDRDASARIFIPSFHSDSFIQYNTLSNVAQSFVIEIWFMTRSDQGLILYNGQRHADGRGDFFALSIQDSRPEFRFDLGSGGNNSLVVRSQQPISIQRWHRIRMTRVRKLATMQLDDGPIEVREAGGSLSELNLDQPMYIGGHELVKEFSWAKQGLDGAVQRIVVNGEIWDDLLFKSIASKNVLEYKGPPCASDNPCTNDGVCIPKLNDYVCKCNNRFTGRRCQKPLSKEDMDRPVAFEGSTYMSFSNQIG